MKFNELKNKKDFYCLDKLYGWGYYRYILIGETYWCFDLKNTVYVRGYNTLKTIDDIESTFPEYQVLSNDFKLLQSFDVEEQYPEPTRFRFDIHSEYYDKEISDIHKKYMVSESEGKPFFDTLKKAKIFDKYYNQDYVLKMLKRIEEVNIGDFIIQSDEKYIRVKYINNEFLLFEKTSDGVWTHRKSNNLNNVYFYHTNAHILTPHDIAYFLSGYNGFKEVFLWNWCNNLSFSSAPEEIKKEPIVYIVTEQFDVETIDEVKNVILNYGV